jgi:general secretion pathway protein D
MPLHPQRLLNVKTLSLLLLWFLLAVGLVAQDDPVPDPVDEPAEEQPQLVVNPNPSVITNAPAPTVTSAPAVTATPAFPAPAPTITRAPAPTITPAPAPAGTPAPALPAPNPDALRQAALQRALTNRLPQASTNRPAFPSFPSPPAPFTSPAARPASPSAAAPAAPAGQPAASAAQPVPPAAAPIAATTNTTPIGNLLTFNNAPLDVIFDRYQELAQRTVLRPANLAGAVTIRTHAELTREEALQALEGALALNGITLIPQGEKFVKAVLTADANQHGATINTNAVATLPESERFTTHVAQLKIAKPSEVATLFSQSFTKNVGGLVPIDSSQILVIRDTSSNVKRMLEMLEKIDIVPETDFKLEVIPIRYGKVGEIYDTMSSIISGGGGGGGYLSSRTTQRAGGLGSRLGTASRGRTGAYGQYGQSGQYGQPGQYQPGINQPGMNPLQSAQQRANTPGASTFQQRLNQIVNRAAGDSDIQILQDARIVPDERANSLIVFANKTDMAMITNIVAKVDQLLAQVLIEAVILEVNFSDSLAFGVSAVQTPQRWGDFAGTGGYNNGQSFLSGLTNFPNGMGSGFNYWAHINPSMNVVIQALAKNGNAKVLSRPRIQTSHANPGSFFIGQSVPYITGTYDYGGYYGGSYGARSQYTEKNIGINLDVTPFITPEGFVVMEVMQTYDAIASTVQIDNNPVPVVNSRQASALLTVRDGESVMLGGFITENRTKDDSGVPVLKDLPLLGPLFRSTSKSSQRTELLVFMRATVLKKPEDAATLVQKEKQRLPGLMEAEADFLQSYAKRLEQAQDHLRKITNSLPPDLRP